MIIKTLKCIRVIYNGINKNHESELLIKMPIKFKTLLIKTHEVGLLVVRQNMQFLIQSHS